MKLPVIKAFIDKNTGEPYNTGATFESEDKDRVKELQEKGFLLVLAPKPNLDGKGTPPNSEGNQKDPDKGKNKSKSE
ncbi:hypothetical protein SDC9_116731 [bioreactor metagenome]|uniref:Uncharacterized protein n=1 Tax=bioreactor metagenome TaxID=1076179 RepID=A0A645C367_9ZZZZ